jgi:tetratricopeptide (TPR) repeat protein
MQPVDVLIELRKIFSTTKAQRVIPVLRRDPLLWAALQDEPFFRKMVVYAGDEPDSWSPAVMALVALTEKPEAHQSIPSLVEQVKKSSPATLRLLDETRQIVRQPKNLVEAGNLALALLQRFTVQEPGRVLLQEIMPLPGEAERPALLIWQTPLAILAGLVPDPVEVLRSLMPKRISALAQQWVCHAIFSNPFDNEKKSDLFTALLTGLPPAQQLSWLRQINRSDQSDLVAEIARRLLSKTSISSAQLLSKTNLDLIDIESAIVRCLELQRLAGLYRFANQPVNAKVMLQKAQSIVQHWMAGLGLQDADLAGLDEHADAGLATLQNALTLGGSSNGMQSEILMSVAKTEDAEKLVEQLSDQTTNPISQIFLASRIARTGEHEFGREMANRAVELWLQQVARQPLPFTSQFAIEWHPLTLVQTLVDLQMPQQAIAVAMKFQEIRPADTRMNLLLSHIHDQLGDTRQALVYAQLSTIISPEDPAAHAWLSTLWGKLGNWPFSYEEQHQSIFLMAQPMADNWSALARCAVMLKDWQKVEEACEQALTINPDHGSALAMKGQAYLETGKLDEAGKLLSRATLLAPEEAETWLQLARLYQRINNPQRAMETLRAAVLAVPLSAEINFALARACLENGLTSDALPFLRKASSLDPTSIDISVDLGETLCVLGHNEEALQLIEQARSKWPQHARLAYTHAQAALSNGNRDTALKALEVALDSGKSEFGWYLLFARTILGKNLYQNSVSKSDYAWIIKAEQALHKALALQPDHYETHLLLAEVFQRKGNYELAYQKFEELMERPEFHATEFHWRVQAGLGQVALHLEQYDSALASLQEAVQDQPDNVYLQRLLAESYILSRLEKQALATARYALKLAPDDLENLIWFADIMTRLKEPLEAIQALRTATQLAPDNPIHWLKLAELYLHLNDYEAARANLKKMLSLGSQLEREHLHQAASAFLSMGDQKAVLDCLVKIESPDSGVQMEIAYFASQTGQLELGVKAVQNAALQDQEETAIYVVEADLLTGMKRPDAALACLEHALHLLENRSREDEQAEDKWADVANRNLVPLAWLSFVRTTEAIHDQLAKLFYQMGDFGSALHHAEQALDLCQKNYGMRLQAAEICEALLMVEREDKVLVGLQLPASLEDNQLESDEVKSLAQLLAMRAELAFEAGNLPETRGLIDRAAQVDPDQSRL